MLSMAVQSPVNNISTYPLLFSQKFNPTILKTPILLKPAAHRIHSSTVHGQKQRTILRKQRQANTFAAPEALTAESESDTIESEDPFSDQETQMAEVLVKKVEKPRLVLKFIWMEKNIGLALDQVIPGHGTVPLSPYFFWPRKDAWEELKATLESKPWISQKKMIILLNQATDIINLWQQSGGSLNTQ